MRRELIESYYEEYQRELERFLNLTRRCSFWKQKFIITWNWNQRGGMADRRCGRHWTGLFQRKMQWRELWQKKCISGDFWIMKDWCVKKTVRSE